MWNLKSNTNESIYTHKRTLKHRKQTYCYQRGDKEGEGRTKNLGLTGTKNYIQYLVITYNEK